MSSQSHSQDLPKTKPTWGWLQSRLNFDKRLGLDQWLDARLDALEKEFASLVTVNSRERAENRNSQSPTSR
ncbi:MAG: hypothetical protein KDB03_16840 [Planctomycetales bacterium]|nr:hypothetical protein [Planctomycetales bacterium]